MKLYRNRSKVDNPKWLVGRHNKRSPNASSESRFFIKLKTLKQTNSRQRLLATTLVVVSVVALLWVPIIKISCQTEVATPCNSKTLYSKTVKDSLPPLGLRIVPLINNAELEAKLLSLGSVSTASVTRNWLNILTVKVVERVPVAIWVKGTIKLTVAKSGHTIANISLIDQSGNDELIIIKDKTDLSPGVGDGVIDPTSLAWALAISQDKPIKGFTLRSIELDDKAREMVVVLARNTSKKQLKVRLTTGRSYEEQLLDINLALAYFREKGRTISYLDVRLPSATAYR